MTEQLEGNKQTVMAFYDLMFNQGQPREGWDVLQVVPDTAANKNSMF